MLNCTGFHLYVTSTPPNTDVNAESFGPDAPVRPSSSVALSVRSQKFFRCARYSEDTQLVFLGDQCQAACLDAFHLDFNDHAGIGNRHMTFGCPTPIHGLCDLMKLPGPA